MIIGQKIMQGILDYGIFDTVEFIFINDETQEVERFFAGDYDTYSVGRAQWWSQRFVAEEYPEIESGLIQRKKYINFAPAGSWWNCI